MTNKGIEINTQILHFSYKFLMYNCTKLFFEITYIQLLHYSHIHIFFFSTIHRYVIHTFYESDIHKFH